LDLRQGWLRFAEGFEDSQRDSIVDLVEVLWARGAVAGQALEETVPLPLAG
jgi:hypothetical protein